MSGIAFQPEEFGEALKDFVGQIVATDYSMEPFGFAGAPGITRKNKVLGLQIRTDAYDKDQYEWLPPSRVKKTKLVECQTRARAPMERVSLRERLATRFISTGVRWAYFIEALNACGAMKDVSIGGATDDERMASLAQSLLGMEFRFQEQECESLVKERGGVTKKFNLLIPVEYTGKKAIEAVPTVRQERIDEPTGAGAPGEPVTEGEPTVV